MDLEERLGYTFRNGALLLEALTHPSFAAEQNSRIPQNQRLEFLGDAVLQLAATDFLFSVYPGLDEGRLTKLRSALTKEEALARMAAHLELGEYLRLGKGEIQTGGQARSSTLSDAFEAVLGALYVDGGCLETTAFFRRLVTAVVPDPLALLEHENPKGRLQEFTQERFSTMPVYRILTVSGPDHLPQFEVSVEICGERMGMARAGSRRQAEKEAAHLALLQLAERGWDKPQSGNSLAPAGACQPAPEPVKDELSSPLVQGAATNVQPT